jgi:hypothetical protein
MKKLNRFFLAVVLAVVMSFGVLSVVQGTPSGATDDSTRAWLPTDTRYLHVATADNTVGSLTYLDHPRLNENPNAKFIVTKNGNAGGGFTGTINEHVIGVWYSSSVGRWAIVNQDLAAMPVGYDYNILIPFSGEYETFVHTVTVSNQSGNYTLIDRPITNNEPDAIVFITQVLNPGGGTGFYNDHPVGVWYNTAANKWAIFNQDGAGMPLNISFFVLVSPVDVGKDFAFVHTASPETLTAGSTFLNHREINDDTHALLFVTQNWNPGGSGGIYNPYSVEVYYNPLVEGWAINNLEPGTSVDMTQGASFNVLILPGEDTFFQHVATGDNTNGFISSLGRPESTNLNILYNFTYVNLPGGPGNLNEHFGMVFYYGTLRWAIQNQDLGTNIPEGAAFNLFLPNMDAGVFTHASESHNTSGNSTYLEHPLTGNNEDAIVFINPNYNPGGVLTGLVANDTALGVWYSNSADQWAIFTQDGSSMPLDADFNIFIPHPGDHVFVHTVTLENAFGPYTILNHPKLNNNPNAGILLTQNWNPGGTGGIYNNSPMGLRFDNGRWEIWNQNGTDIPVGASINVFFKAEALFIPFVGK